MRKQFAISLLFISIITSGQSSKISIDWENIEAQENLPQRETAWMLHNLSALERTEIISLVSALSQPSVSQMLVSYFYLDGSFSRKSIIPYIDSFKIRPPDGMAGVIRVAYLASRFRKEIIGDSNIYPREDATGKALTVPEFNQADINPNIELSFDFQPAQLILEILSEPNIGYYEIIDKLDLPQFEALVKHRSQSFYYTTTSMERMASCLEIASSTKPLDELYKYINPSGLLDFTEVINHLEEYRQQTEDISNNEEAILEYINASISPYLPDNAEFSRKVSFFYISGADGWASADVVGVDLNKFRKRTDDLFDLLVHETYHGGQNAVYVEDTTQREENVQLFIDILDYLLAEGTATYVASPQIISAEYRDEAILKGIDILKDIYQHTIEDYDLDKTMQFVNIGFENNGPLYWLGEEMSRSIVKQLGENILASIVPYGGLAFVDAYFEAVNQSGKPNSLFCASFSKELQGIK